MPLSYLMYLEGNSVFKDRQGWLNSVDPFHKTRRLATVYIGYQPVNTYRFITG